MQRVHRTNGPDRPPTMVSRNSKYMKSLGNDPSPKKIAGLTSVPLSQGVRYSAVLLFFAIH